MTAWWRAVAAVCLTLAARPAYAQNDAALKEYEGRSVIVKMDMPNETDAVEGVMIRYSIASK